jgi:hypothetical protein
MPLSLRLCLGAAVCALTLACGGNAASSVATPAPAATTADAASPAPTSQPAVTRADEPSVTPPPATAPASTATPQPQATTAPAATSAAAGGAAPIATPAPGSPRPAPITIQVSLQTDGRTFQPHQIHGNYDDSVVVTVRGSDERHSFTIDVLGVDRVIESGSTEVVSFVLPLSLTGGSTTPAHEGIYPFYCRFHGTPTSGMHGLLIFH